MGHLAEESVMYLVMSKTLLIMTFCWDFFPFEDFCGKERIHSKGNVYIHSSAGR